MQVVYPMVTPSMHVGSRGRKQDWIDREIWLLCGANSSGQVQRSLELELHIGVILNDQSSHSATSQDGGCTEKGVTLGKVALCR